MASTVTSAWSDTQLPSMGSTARLLILGGPPGLPDLARERLRVLESRWSRFDPASELCRLNAANGAVVVVSHDSFDVIALAIGSWRATNGWFDPTVLDAVEQAGYDRDFAAVDRLGDRDAADPDAPARPTPGAAGIELLPLLPAVRLPVGVRLDLGGIGKGRAADLLTQELCAAGAEGVCVNLGGDVRVSGVAPEGPDWRVDLDGALAPGRSFRLAEGAVATSTRMRRTWTRGGAPQHHLVDPTTGRPAWTGLAAVTVLAASTATAEVLAKAAFVAGSQAGAELLAAAGVTGLFVRDDGHVEPLPGLSDYLP